MNIPCHVENQARHRDRLATVGLHLNLGKTKYWVTPEYRTHVFYVYWGDIAKYFLLDSTSLSHRGITVYGVPVGLQGYIFTFLEKKSGAIIANVATVCANMHPREATSPEVPGRQCLWVTTLRCIQHLGNYWARHLPPHVTTIFCHTVD